LTVEQDIAPIGGRVHFHAVVGSTNDIALELLRGGAAHGTVVVAEAQSAGRGRRGRAWRSPPGNLYASIVVRPPAGAANGQLAFVAALGAADSIGPGLPVRFKWPNDLLAAGRKVGGILIEAESGGAVIGLGINVAVAPKEVDYPATSLADQGLAISVRDLLPAVCRALESWYCRWNSEGFAPVREAWLARAAGMGEAMAVRLPASRLSGVFGGMDDDGALLLKTGEGLRRITSGEVLFGHA
jgi:BirA family biotin operon repressor/biotin-[acetyl-CoA-carboxylase] ligase